MFPAFVWFLFPLSVTLLIVALSQHRNLSDTFFLNKFDLSFLVGERFAAALPSFHAFTGCDSTSDFVRRGKLMPLKLLESTEGANKFLDVFKSLGCTNPDLMGMDEDTDWTRQL